MAGSSSISGLVSGMDTQGMIDKLMELEQVSVNRLTTRKSTLQAQLNAWQDANTRILAVKTKLDALSSISSFDVKSVVSSDESVLTGTADTTAQTGTYYIRVNSLARAEQQKSQGFADTTVTRVGTGTITIQVGSGAAKTINITDANNTLDGVRRAINDAGAGVTASIINDGTPGSPYRLVISSQTSGTSGAVTIGGTLSGGTAPTFSVMQAAQDASVTIGDPDGGGVTVTKSSNVITDLVPGVTLNLQKPDLTKTITLEVKPNTENVKTAIKDFVDQYNNLMDFINKQFQYNTSTNTGGTLFADSTLGTIQADLVNAMFSPVGSTSGSIQLLSQIGLTATSSDNKITIDSDKLTSMLASDPTGVKMLFAGVGNATAAGINFVSSTSKTKATTGDGYAVSITSPATQARVTAGVALAAPLAQDETLTINGKQIQLTAGMTADQVVQKINQSSSNTSVTVSLTDATGQGTGGYLTFKSAAYGSAKTLSVVSSLSSGLGATSGIGTVVATAALPGGESGAGTGAPGGDVAGTINGEPATGSGQFLTGMKGNLNTEGLQIRVTVTAPGDYGYVTCSKGIASIVDDYLGFITASTTGAVSSMKDYISAQMSQIDKDIAAEQDRLQAKRDQLSIKFAIMESTLSKLQSQGSYISGQIASLSSNKSSS